MRLLFLLMGLFPTLSLADYIVATKTIRANSIITEQDIRLVPGDWRDGIDKLENAVGQETRQTVYAGRPLRLDEIGPPALVVRNQIVLLTYAANGLHITADGRALERGAVGDRIRIMNLSSRAMLFGQVSEDGSINVLR